MHATHNDLSPATRNKINNLLAPLLADSIDLFTQVKQAHWNVRGAGFIALHELFDKVAQEVVAASDELAERILQLGGEAEGTARVTAKRSRLKEYPLTLADGPKHVAALAGALSTFLQSSREAIDESDKFGDAVTADILTGIVRGLDKQLWFIEAHESASQARPQVKSVKK